MQIYNTLSRRKEKFEPLNPPFVTFYMCGPTVYDFFHIGNGRSFIMSDIFRRFLIFKGFKVKFVMNLTDIDDKIIKKANEQKSNISQVSEKFITEFFTDIDGLKIKQADLYPRATQHLEEIINLIQKLIDKNMAYVVDGDVFYNVSNFVGYGKLSGKKIDELESGARIEINEIKQNPLDFSLWKKAKEGEPYWESPWGKGRPGWHIECSAMSTHHLGETIDIHAGGTDLVFPHHENEIAQSEGALGKDFVKYWMHFGFLNIKDEKMSKSLGNFFTARDILKKHRAEAIRLLFTQTHYRGPLNYSDELIEAAEKGVEKLNNFYRILQDKISASTEGVIPQINIQNFEQQFEAAMDDDFNTPQAVAVIFDFIREINKEISGNNILDKSFLIRVNEFINKSAIDVLGIINPDVESSTKSKGLEEDLINILIDLRTNAKLNKNYALADEIRDKLATLGITLRDGKEGTGFIIN